MISRTLFATSSYRTRAQNADSPGSQTPVPLPTLDTIGKEHFVKLRGERWVLFDLGNVVIPFNHNRVAKGLEPYLSKQIQQGTTRPSIHNFFFDSEGDEPRNTQLDRGVTTLTKVHRDFCRRFKCNISYSKFDSIWCSIFEPMDPAAMSCLSKARKLRMKVGICSNTNQAHWNYVRKLYPKLVKSADECFLSFEIKTVKSDPLFFEKVAKVTECPIEDHLLIDDMSSNLEPAKASGMQVMQVQRSLTYEDVEDVLRELHWV